VSILRALGRAVRAGGRAYGDEMQIIRRTGEGSVLDPAHRAKRSALDELTSHRSDVGSIDEPGVTYVPLPNRATMTLQTHSIVPDSPAYVDWEWDDVGMESGLAAGRSRRQVAETIGRCARRSRSARRATVSATV